MSAIDTHSNEHKLQCLARHFMRTAKDSSHLSQLFDSYQKKSGKAARDELRERVVTEQAAQRKAAIQARQEIADMLGGDND